MQGLPFVLKSEDKIISTVLQYHSWLETVNLLVTARAHVVRRIALFFSRDAASHSWRVFRLWMLDCLTTLVDQFADSVGLPAMWNLTSTFLQIVLYRLRCGSKLYTNVPSSFCTENHWSTWALWLLAKSACYRCWKLSSTWASCCSRSLYAIGVWKFCSTWVARIYQALFSIKQADVGNPCLKNLGSLIEMSREVIRVAYVPSIYVYCLPFGYRCLGFSSLIENLRPRIVFL